MRIFDPQGRAEFVPVVAFPTIDPVHVGVGGRIIGRQGAVIGIKRIVKTTARICGKIRPREDPTDIVLTLVNGRVDVAVGLFSPELT